MWLLYAFGSAVFAGITAILAKVGVRDINSNLATALRTGVVLVFAWVMVFLVGSQKEVLYIGGRTLLFLCASGLATGASWLCYFKALQLGNVNQVTPIDKSSTVLTMLLAVGILGEKLTWFRGAAMALILIGTLLMIQKKEGVGAKRGNGWLLFAVLSALFASLTAILGKIGISDVESNLGTAIRTCVVLVMAWLVVLLTGSHRGARVGGRNWLFLILSGISTGASWLCYYKALQLGEASVVVPIDKLSILLTVAFAWLFLKEKLSTKAGVGLALLVAGTLLLLL